jgi:hypothetical protein
MTGGRAVEKNDRLLENEKKSHWRSDHASENRCWRSLKRWYNSQTADSRIFSASPAISSIKSRQVGQASGKRVSVRGVGLREIHDLGT